MQVLLHVAEIHIDFLASAKWNFLLFVSEKDCMFGNQATSSEYILFSKVTHNDLPSALRVTRDLKFIFVFLDFECVVEGSV